MKFPYVRILAVLAAFSRIAFMAQAMAQTNEDADALQKVVDRLFDEKKYEEAIPIAHRVIALREQALGPDHPSVARALCDLGSLYQDHGRYDRAEPLHKRSLAIWERSFGPNHPDVAEALNELGRMYDDQGRYAEGVPLLERSVAIFDDALGPDHMYVAISLGNLASIYDHQGRYGDAEPLYTRSIAIREKVFGPDDLRTILTVHKLGALKRKLGYYSDAELLLKRTLEIREKVLGPDHVDISASLNSLAVVYNLQGRYGEAEALYKRSLAISEKALGPDHPDIATRLSNLATVYVAQDRHNDAEALLKRSLAVREKANGPDHPDVAISLNNLAQVFEGQGRYIDAEPLYTRSITIWEKALGPDHPDLANGLNNMALLYKNQGHYRDAEALLRRSLAIDENALGRDHTKVAVTLSNLAGLHEAEGRYSEAEPLYERGLGIFEKVLGPDHPNVATTLANMAWLALARNDWREAEARWRASTAILQRRAGRNPGRSQEGLAKGEAQRKSEHFSNLVKVTRHHASQDPVALTRLGAEMFEMAQWAQSSEAATSLAQMTVRGAAGDPALSTLVRERQNLIGEWQAKDNQLIAARSGTPDKRDKDAEKALADRLVVIDGRLGEIDAVLAKDFPDYSALANPRPVSLMDAQASLRDDEALILFLDTSERKPTPEETFIWVVTKTDMRWVRSDLGSNSLKERVGVLRCSLDSAGWDGRSPACPHLLGLDPNARRPNTLPFDLSGAHALYKKLFSDVEDLIRDKHLLLVPSGPLQQLPFQVLVTELPGASGKPTPWLIRRHAITVLPSVSNLKALRDHSRPVTTHRRSYVAFANPLLNGKSTDDKARAALASAKRNCAAVAQVEEIVTMREEAFGTFSAAPLLGGVADVLELRHLPPVPQTANLACDVARQLGATEDDIHLGARATEASVKAMSASGLLASYAVVNFATHGIVAGEFKASAEPGLVLTPPEMGTEDDDGYLSASEVAGLKLDADWIILSACNTASGGANDAEALSGLARSFFYAGAQALLVSHWSVRESAALTLVTKTLEAMALDNSMGRAEAMRRAMIDLADSADPVVAHPSYWAPFGIVGEGAAA